MHSQKSQSFLGMITAKGMNRQIEFLSDRYYQYYLRTQLDVGDKVSVNITNKKPKRTIRQNSFLWAYYTLIAQDTGHSPEEIHEWAKGKFLPSKVVDVMGDKVRMKASTTDLSVSEFIEYVMKIEAETGIVMPPLENWDLNIR